jgi:cell division protein FtsQ
MWDRPDILNRISNGLCALAGVLVLYAVIHYVVHLPAFALREVRVLGAAGYVTHEQVQAIVATEMKGTFFTLNLPGVRKSFEKLPWVRTVRMRRHWPDRLEVTVETHVPLARWGKNALVNTHGEVFHAAYDARLPVFVGPPGSSKEIAIQYEFFRRVFKMIDASPVLVQLTPRRAWQVRLEGGPTIELGRENMEDRLMRFIAVHERSVRALNRRVDYIDLRYANGFAVRIPELKGEQGERAPSRAKRGTRAI